MIWLNKAKEFIGYIVSGDTDKAKEMVSQDIDVSIYEKFPPFIIQRTAYNDKVIFIEGEVTYTIGSYDKPKQFSEKTIFVIEFDSFGKICYCMVY